jgi:hypothetical protein
MMSNAAARGTTPEILSRRESGRKEIAAHSAAVVATRWAIRSRNFRFHQYLIKLLSHGLIVFGC